MRSNSSNIKYLIPLSLILIKFFLLVPQFTLYTQSVWMNDPQHDAVAKTELLQQWPRNAEEEISWNLYYVLNSVNFGRAPDTYTYIFLESVDKKLENVM